MKFWRKVAYAEGNFANTVCAQVFTNRIQFYYVDLLGVGAGIIGLLWSLFGIWNAVNDPLMGAISDRTRSRWGRRVPYLAFGAIPLGLAFFLMWTPPRNNVGLTAAYFFVTVVVFDGLYSLLVMAYNALFPEVATELRDRSSLSAIRTGMGVIALLVAYILAPVLSESIGYVGMGAVIAILTSIGYLIVILGSQEDPERMKEPAEGLINALRLTLKSVPYRWYMGGHICRDFIFLITSATLPFWSKYVLKMTTPKPVFGMILEPANQEALLLAVPFLLSVPCLLIWNFLTPRIGARRTWMVGVLTYLPACLVIILADGFYTGLLGTALLAPGIAALSMMPLIQLAEVIDDDARRTGKRREGAFMGMSSGIAKLSFTIQGLLFATILPLSGYVPNVADQARSAIWGIRFLMGGATVIAVWITVFCLHRLRLPGPGVEETGVAPLPEVRRQRAVLGD